MATNRWAKMGGIPKVLDFTTWKPGAAMMEKEIRLQPLFKTIPQESAQEVIANAQEGQRIADAAIYRLLTHGRRG